jgi:hypothetical protein
VVAVQPTTTAAVRELFAEHRATSSRWSRMFVIGTVRRERLERALRTPPGRSTGHPERRLRRHSTRSGDVQARGRSNPIDSGASCSVARWPRSVRGSRPPVAAAIAPTLSAAAPNNVVYRAAKALVGGRKPPCASAFAAGRLTGRCRRHGEEDARAASASGAATASAIWMAGFLRPGGSRQPSATTPPLSASGWRCRCSTTSKSCRNQGVVQAADPAPARYRGGAGWPNQAVGS